MVLHRQTQRKNDRCLRECLLRRHLVFLCFLSENHRMGCCTSRPLPYSAPCSRCAPGTRFSHVDATAMMEEKREIGFFARYRLRHNASWDTREKVVRAGFKIIFPNDRNLPIYSCDRCLMFSPVKDEWVYSRTGFLRLD